MASRPTERPAWTQGNPGVQDEPTSPEKFGGFAPNQRPSPQWVNWILGNISDWIDWLDQVTQLAIVQFKYDATVGSGGTYADINALVAAITGGANIHSVLVISNITFSVTQVITSGITDLLIEFKKGTVMAKGGSTTPGISVAGQRIDLLGARMSTFNGGSDVAIQLESTCKNSRVLNCNFLSCTTAVNDLGANNEELGSIEEV